LAVTAVSILEDEVLRNPPESTAVLPFRYSAALRCPLVCFDFVEAHLCCVPEPAAFGRTTVAVRPSSRLSFAKIQEPLQVPDLLALQTQSFDWLMGNDIWRDRVAAAQSKGEVVPTASGLEEIFEEISPIEDIGGTMSLSFRDHRFEDPKYSIEDCKDRDATYSKPLFVTAEFMNNETGEIKSQTVFMGDFPIMTPKGTFVINGTERVVVSQLVRSPGVYFERSVDKITDKEVFIAKIIPSRGCSRRPQAQAARHGAAQGARLDFGSDSRALR
jgi:DNA-directed RNA polymerase beta subunit